MSNGGYVSLNPVQVEQKLVQSVRELYAAEKDLAEARDAEVEAEIAYQSSRRRLLLSDACPKVSRGSVTVADRDAWVDNECADEWMSYRLTQVKCQAAQDHVRTVRDVASTVQSIASLVRQAYSMAGTT
jgi:hypothetical protein